MKTKKLLFTFLFATLLGGFTSVDSKAQCAMCRATVESNLSDGSSSVGAGLNKGILYLVSFPYLVCMVIAFFWYRSSKENYEKRLKTTGYPGRAMP
ncbi:MAG: hypothetical protein H7Z75_09270 [Ferruginibacter sp.]|nr:hypothetical protein [Cytophagales bacterium]